MELDDLGPAEHFAAGAVGPPGQRRFYLQVRAGGDIHTLAAEKGQVAALASQGLEILVDHEISSDDEAVDRLIDQGLGIDDPGEGGERFRVGTITLAMAPSELLTVTIESIEEDEAVAFVIAPEQFKAMATVALKVVAAGRPMCPWCRLPMDPENHECPARN
ncbi:MAG: DUF3090 family protein [Acidimicrobiia bacterium]|nr:DUF3090 family protein [Acidimicrobiia bacterium]MDH4306522.1 DUF3090 family protein [Acidimicrobiia bacterium]MDH5292544.1 DUF3090 family protein [Acidimicrobiia bacterium]